MLIHRLKRLAPAIILLAVAGTAISARAADEVVAADGTKTLGWIVTLTAENATVLTDKDGLKRVPIRGATIRFDFAAQARCAVVTRGDKQTVAARLTSFKDDAFGGATDDGKEWACARADVRSAEFYPTARLGRSLPVAHSRQKPDYCGEACVEMVSKYLGRPVTQDQVNAAGGLDGKRGVYSNELERAVVGLKLRAAPAAASLPHRTPEDAVADRWQLVRAIERNRPVLLGIWADPERKTNPAWNFDHFVLLVGYDLRKQAMIVHDPGHDAFTEWSFTDFPKHRETRSHLVYQIEFPSMRAWTMKDGAKVDGEFVGCADGRVRLRDSAGGEKVVALADLSDADQEYIEKLK